MNNSEKGCRQRGHNTQTRKLRGWRLVGLLAWLGLAFLPPRVALGAVLDVDVGTHTLIGDQATPQTIVLFVNNSSGSPISVGGLDFYLQLGTGAGTTPSIFGVDLLNGTIFSGGSQSGEINNGLQLQYYSVLKAAGPGPVIPTGSSQLAAISFQTIGTTSGSFSLLLSVSGVGSTDYLTDTGDPTRLGLTFTPGTLNVVPVPEPVDLALPIFGGVAGLIGGVRRWYRGRNSGV